MPKTVAAWSRLSPKNEEAHIQAFTATLHIRDLVRIAAAYAPVKCHRSDGASQRSQVSSVAAFAIFK